MPIILFLLIYGPRLGGHNLFDLVSMTSLGLIIFRLIIDKKSFILKTINFQLFLLGFLILYSLFVSIYSDEKNLFYFLKFTRVLINLLGVWCIVWYYQKVYGVNYFQKLLHHIFLVILVHALIMTISFFSPLVNDILDGIRGPTRGKSYRKTGLTISFNTLGIVQGTGLLIAIISDFGRVNNVKPLVYYLGLPVIIFSMFISGRSASYVMLGLGIISLIALKQVSIKSIIAMISTSIGIVLIALSIIPNNYLLIFTNYTFLFWIDPLTYFFYSPEESLITQSTFLTLSDMVFFPEGLDLFLGTSSNGRDSVSIKSDIGYILFIWGIGIIGLVICLIYYFEIIYFSIKLIKKDKQLFFLLLLTTLSIIILHGKEQVLFTRHAFTVTSLFYIIAKINFQSYRTQKTIS
jgi:hypothetical protein